MKLDWKKLLFGLFVGVGMTMMPACSNDEGVEVGGDGQEKEVTGPAETGYLSMKLSLGSAAGTKASPGTVVGRDEEQTVKEVWVVLYDKYGATKYLKKLTASNEGGTFQGTSVSGESVATSSRFVTTGIPVDKKEYQMLVLVNPVTAEENTFRVGGSGASVLTDIAYAQHLDLTETDGWAEDNHFFMSNSQGLVTINESDIKSSAKDAEKHPISVSVDRGVAKVIVDKNNVPTVPDGDVFTNIKWDLDVTNRSAYWIRNLGYLSGGVTEEKPGDGSSRYDRYAKDPNFSGYSGQTLVQLSGFFDYLKDKSAITVHTPYENMSVEFSSADNYRYAYENTMAADEQNEDVTTRVALAGRYTPKGLDVSSGNYSFYTFAGKVIRVDYMRDCASDDAAITAELKSLGLVEAISKVKAEVGETVFSNPTIPFSSNGINYYADGICYYTIPIRHFDNDQASQSMAYGRYGVVRNNVYSLLIKKISGVGSPVLEGPGPGPNDGKTSISADIQILPWQIRSQEVEDL